MSCASCVAHVERALRAVPGVSAVAVNLATESAAVTSQSGRTPAMIEAVERAGYEVPTRTIRLHIGGMSCASCVGRVEAALRAVPGVLQAQANLANELATVRVIEGAASPTQLARAVEAAGYTGSACDATDEPDRYAQESRAAWREAALALAAALPLAAPMLLGVAGVPFEWPAWLQCLLAAFVLFYCARHMAHSALGAIRARTGNMDVLVLLGSLAAFALSLYLWLAHGHRGHLYFESSAVLIALVLLGRALEAGARRRTTAAVRALAALRPERVRVLADGQPREVRPEELRVGDIVLVRPGERIGVDGLIVAGRGWLDESLVTGESLPVERRTGETVICGATLTVPDTPAAAGELHIQATAVGDATVLASMIRMVEQAQAAKAPVQRLADQVAAVFVPAVLAVAALTLAIWLLRGAATEHAVLAAVSVLVIACPCALGLATPTAIIAGTGAAARRGILVRDAETMERVRQVQVVAFDKTGTLTLGKPRVAQLLTTGIQRAEALRLAAAVGSASDHPLAHAVRDALAESALTAPDAVDAAVHAGEGVSCMLEGRRMLFGQERWLTGMGARLDALREQVRALESSGHSVSWLAEQRGEGPPVPLAVFAFADPLRPGAADAVAALKTAGIEAVLISGDSEGAVARIARECGIERFEARVSPGQKLVRIGQLRSGPRVVAMVGDGINDAPALAAADIGIAMGSGTDVAMNAAGVVLMRSDPRLVAEAIAVSRATVGRIRQNLVWAFVYNLIGIPLAAAGALTPVIAAGAMALSSLSVVANSLRLTRVRQLSRG